MGVILAGRAALNRDALSEPLLEGDSLPERRLGGSAAGDLAAEVQRDALGRIVLSLLQALLPGTIHDLQMPRALRIVRQLRLRVLLMLFTMLLTAPLALVLLVQGTAAFLETDSSKCCGTERLWILGFIAMQFCWPLCMPQVTVLFLGWTFSALSMMHKHDHCEPVHRFLLTACVLQLTQLTLLLISALTFISVRSLIESLREMMNGGTDPEVLRLIEVVPAQELTEEACVICLSCDAEGGELWRKLACGHRFHETCVLEWLGKARRCPVCRLDLHSAYERQLQESQEAS